MNIRLTFLFKLFVMSLFFVSISPFAFAQTASNTQSVAGYWQTMDSKTKKPSSIISIQPQGQFFDGKIVKIFSVKPERKAELCIRCKGSQKNQPILGLTIINQMVCQPEYCTHGTILDPRDGKLYHATMRLTNQGQQLKVRGYVGVPLFGKTVIWQRVMENAVK
jgi:uncharacterized protein (DUF2147 family)